MTRIDTVDEDGLTPREQAIAKRLFQRWEDSFGNLTIQADPRDVALWLRDLVQEAQADAWDQGYGRGFYAATPSPDASENPYRNEAP